MRVNNSPVRTSNNFNINNINLEKYNIEQIYKTCQNWAKDDILEIEKQIKYEQEQNKIDFKLDYGTGFITKPNYFKAIDKSTVLSLDVDKYLSENIYICAKENQSLEIKIIYKSNFQQKSLHSGIIKVIANSNSKVDLTIINLTNYETLNFLSVQTNLKKDSVCNLNIADFGGKIAISNIYEKLEENAKSNISSIYFANKEQLFDLNYIVDLKGVSSYVDINVQGALDDFAKKHFKGTINFIKGAKKSSGAENENVVILSDKCSAISLPMLLCSEEDVERSHSTSAGNIDLNTLFYLMSRGFSKIESEKLLIRAKFNNVIEKLTGDLKEELEKQIDKKLMRE